ncbi:AraC family transcriptional regulator [Pontibacter sp. HSC-36F09]|uniref:helix-turn-helix domain-containing protein n=1 Tax=Pontibacter sp. HSC-36F09 TaxID=2910966 RepID=UPI00209E8CC0|nr:helix-turn-helix domain-containing protein [Pontibacter sp. HSC-36F09]MCP2044188.1 AraC-like DNA-binding protein [Pontibacter sp. HSC-36F09]
MEAYQDIFQLQKHPGSAFARPSASEFYNILLLEGSGTLSVDFTDYTFDGKIALFTSPYQHLCVTSGADFEVDQLIFHGDFYCIEYHKNEVACNGLLFNNIYKQPFITLQDEEIRLIFDKLRSELSQNEPHSEPILRSYLQLILAIASRIKKREQQLEAKSTLHPIEQFRELVEQHFLTQRNTPFYAEQMALSHSAFARKVKKHFGKSPSQLIQDRVVLEAKKQLHLTHKSIKEASAALNFEDEHYFSRYFKKHTGISPTHFREKVGISVVADLSMR